MLHVRELIPLPSSTSYLHPRVKRAAKVIEPTENSEPDVLFVPTNQDLRQIHFEIFHGLIEDAGEFRTPLVEVQLDIARNALSLREDEIERGAMPYFLRSEAYATHHISLHETKPFDVGSE